MNYLKYLLGTLFGYLWYTYIGDYQWTEFEQIVFYFLCAISSVVVGKD